MDEYELIALLETLEFLSYVHELSGPMECSDPFDIWSCPWDPWNLEEAKGFHHATP